MTSPLPLESFHVKRTDDVKDGAFLVPKVILVAVHCPGVKVIDDVGETGQLDALYDEASEVGADMLVMYVDLPLLLYSPLRHGLYHDRLAELLFRSQPLLKTLAVSHSLITVSAHSDLNPTQKNFLRDWLEKPVDLDHAVYQTATKLSFDVGGRYGEPGRGVARDYASDGELLNRSAADVPRNSRNNRTTLSWVDNEGFVAAVDSAEDEPLIGRARGCRSGARMTSSRTRGNRQSYGAMTSSRRLYFRSRSTPGRTAASRDDPSLLIPLISSHGEDDEEGGDDDEVELCSY